MKCIFKLKLICLLIFIHCSIIKSLITSGYLYLGDGSKRILVIGNSQPHNLEVKNKIRKKIQIQLAIFRQWEREVKNYSKVIHSVVEFSNVRFNEVAQNLDLMINIYEFGTVGLILPVMLVNLGSFNWVENRNGLFYEFLLLFFYLNQFDFNIKTFFNLFGISGYSKYYIHKLLENIDHSIRVIKIKLQDQANKAVLEFLNKKLEQLTDIYGIFKFVIERNIQTKETTFVDFLLGLEHAYDRSYIRNFFTSTIIPLSNELIQNSILVNLAYDINNSDASQIICMCSQGHVDIVCKLLELMELRCFRYKKIRNYFNLNALNERVFFEFNLCLDILLKLFVPLNSDV